MSLVSIVIPVYHNAASLPELLEKLQQVAAQNAADQFEFVFVDDGSGDNSLQVLTDLADGESRMRVVKLSRNFGSTAAITAGLSQARGDVVAAVAADLQDPPELIHDMIGAWREGRKVVLAAREGRQDPFPTSMLADLFYFLFRRFALKTMPKRGFDFFLIDRQVVDLITSIQENNTYLMGLILWLGFDPHVIYYQRQEREARFGQSMWTFSKKLKYFADSFVAFSYFPVRLASTAGLLFTMAGALYSIWIVGLRLTRGVDVAGWSSLAILLLVSSGIQMLILGIIGEYLWRTLDETRKRPRFIIESVHSADATDGTPPDA